MADIKEQLDQIKIRVSDANFLANKGLSNEVGIHVFCYAPAEELLVQEYIKRLHAEPIEGVRIIECDLYELFLDVLKDKGVLDKVASLEESKGKDHLLKSLQRTVPPSSILKMIEYAPHERGDVVFLTGIGKVYPFIRAHSLLETMQQAFADIPVVMFYPGEYNGQCLNLFNKFFDGNHYRSFNLL